MDAALLAAIVVGALVIIGAVFGTVRWAQASPRRTLSRESAPPPVYMPHEHAGVPAVRPSPHIAPSAAALGMSGSSVHERADADVQPLALAVGAERERPRSVDASGIGLRPRRRAAVGRAAPEPAEAAISPLTGTLRMLPGRLEVVSGLEQRAEIRFVHTGGAGDQRVTLGRAPGAPYEHVTLPSQTVSREHAAMTYTRSGWAITNLSTTNPLRVNGAAVDVAGASVLLSDGDMVELGEVVLRFRV